MSWPGSPLAGRDRGSDQPRGSTSPPSRSAPARGAAPAASSPAAASASARICAASFARPASVRFASFDAFAPILTPSPATTVSRLSPAAAQAASTA